MQYDASTYDPEIAGVAPQSVDTGRPDGAHGTGSRFMPLTTMAKDSSPAVVCIAGVYPGLTVEQLRAPEPVPFAPPGKWNYHMLTGAAAPGGFVAIPGSQLLDDNPDSVAVVCMSKTLGLEFPDGNEHEVLALIDRSDVAVYNRASFDNQKFYALADPSGTVHIRWMKEVPGDWSIQGRLLFTQMPAVSKPGESGGFAETSDEFDF